MTIKNCKALAKLASQANVTPAKFAENLINALTQREIIYGDMADYYACTIKECCSEDANVISIAEAIKECGIAGVKGEHYDAVMQLILKGDYDCPCCGDEMEILDADYDRDPDTNECDIKYIIKRCPNCGKIINE